MAYKADCKDITVMARVTGYMAPVKQFNNGKTAEFKDRKPYNPTGGLFKRKGFLTFYMLFLSSYR